MEQKKDTKKQPESKSFRWLLSIIGEVLLIVPILIILIMFGTFLQDRRQGAQNSQEASRAAQAFSGKEASCGDTAVGFIPLGFYDSVYEDGPGRL